MRKVLLAFLFIIIATSFPIHAYNEIGNCQISNISPGPFKTITKSTGLNVTSNSVPFLQVTLQNGQYAGINIYCCAAIIGVKSGNAIDDITCQGIISRFRKVQNQSTLNSNANGLFPDLAGENYEVNISSITDINPTTSDLSVTIIADIPFDTVNSISLQCNMAVIGNGSVTQL